MKIDAHQHFWLYNSEDYGWINNEMKVLRRDFLPANLAEEQDKVDFNGSVAVQARQCLAETDWLLELANDNPRVMAVVGWLDLQAANFADIVAEYATNPKLKGLRHVVQDEPDDDFMLRPEFQRGIAELKKFDLTYDILIFPKHLSRAIKLVDKFPEQPFVLDHIAKPLIKDQILTPWDREIRELAKRPNVFCKLSGMVTEADWDAWTPEDLHPYMETVIEAFTPKRIMIGSDWPVCNVAGGYSKVMTLVQDFIKNLSPSEQSAILGENAAEFYLSNAAG